MSAAGSPDRPAALRRAVLLDGVSAEFLIQWSGELDASSSPRLTVVSGVVGRYLDLDPAQTPTDQATLDLVSIEVLKGWLARAQSEGRFVLGSGGSITPTGNLGFVADQDLGDRRVLDSQSLGGTRSRAIVDRDSVSVDVSAGSDIGRGGEREVIEICKRALLSRGHAVREEPADDARGIDARLIVDDARVSIQIVTLPIATEYWRDAKVSSATTTVSHDHASSWARDAIAMKAERYSSTERAHTTLALDARSVGILDDPRLLGVLERDAVASGFSDVWLVGPTERHVRFLVPGRW